MSEEFYLNGKMMTWPELSDDQKWEMFRHLRRDVISLVNERNYLRTLLLSQSGRTAEEIDRLKFGW